jgi:hypothetical protein
VEAIDLRYMDFVGLEDSGSIMARKFKIPVCKNKVFSTVTLDFLN